MSNVTVSNLEIMDSISIALTTIQASYGVVCLPVMVFFLFYLAVKKRFKFPFYRFAQMDLLVNICIYLNTWLAMRLEKFAMCIPLLKWIEVTVPGLLTVSRYFTNYFFHLQFLSAAVMTFHRIMLMRGATNSDRYWNRFLVIFYSLALVYSAVPNRLFYYGFPSRTSIVNGTLIRTRYTDLYNSLALCNAVFSTVYFIIMTALGIAAVKEFNKLRSEIFEKQTSMKSNVSETSNSVVVGKTLTKMAITYSAVYSGILFFCVVNGIDNRFKIFPDSLRSISTVVLGFASDLMTLSLPFILMFNDKNVKKELIRIESNGVGSTFTFL